MNIANQITIGRILLTFIFVWLALSGSSQWVKVAYVVGVLAGVSDFFDGYVARKYNMISDFGVFMDPLADKIFIMSAFIVLLNANTVPVLVVLIILIREFAVTGLRLIAIEKNVTIAANFGGKLKTCMQFAYLATVGVVWAGFFSVDLWLIDILMYTTVIITAYTGIEYLVKYSSLYMKSL